MAVREHRRCQLIYELRPAKFYTNVRRGGEDLHIRKRLILCKSLREGETRHVGRNLMRYVPIRRGGYNIHTCMRELGAA